MIAAERAAQSKFESQMAVVATCTRWSASIIAGLVIFESSPSLHNGFYQVNVWLLCIGHCFIGMVSWLSALLAPSCCGRLASSGDGDDGEEEYEQSNRNDYSASMLSVVVVPSAERARESVAAWRCVYRQLMEQTSQHDADRTEVIFVCDASTVPPSYSPDEWVADVLHKMPSCRLQPRLVTYEPTIGGGAIEGFRAGAAHAKGGCVLLIPSDVLLPAGYDQQIRDSMVDEGGPCHVYAGTFGFGIYPRAHSLRIQQEEQAIERLESRLAVANAGIAMTMEATHSNTNAMVETRQQRQQQQQLSIDRSNAAVLFSPAVSSAAGVESELITRRVQFSQLISDPVGMDSSSGSGSGNSHAQSGSDSGSGSEQHYALLPIGVIAVEVCAWVCGRLFKHPRLDHGFFMRTKDFQHVTTGMNTMDHDKKGSDSVDVDYSDSSGYNGSGTGGGGSRTASSRSHQYLQYYELNCRLRKAAWKGKDGRGGVIMSETPSGKQAFGSAARWEGAAGVADPEPDGTSGSGRVRSFLFQELISHLVPQ